jgi:hypothetical protein
MRRVSPLLAKLSCVQGDPRPPCPRKLKSRKLPSPRLTIASLDKLGCLYQRTQRTLEIPAPLKRYSSQYKVARATSKGARLHKKDSRLAPAKPPNCGTVARRPGDSKSTDIIRRLVVIFHIVDVVY